MSYSKKTSKFNKKLAGKTVRVQVEESGELFLIKIISVKRGYSPGNIIGPEFAHVFTVKRNGRVVKQPYNQIRTIAKQNWYVSYVDENNETCEQFLEESILKKFIKQKP